VGIISVLAINDIQRRNPFICEHLNAPERFPEDTPGDWSARQGFLALLVPRCIDMQRRERIWINPAVVKRASVLLVMGESVCEFHQNHGHVARDWPLTPLISVNSDKSDSKMSD